MAAVTNKLKLQLFERTYRQVWENILETHPEYELNQQAALDEGLIRRFMAHIELHGVKEIPTDQQGFARLTYIFMAAVLNIPNTTFGWDNWFKGKTGSLL